MLFSKPLFHCIHSNMLNHYYCPSVHTFLPLKLLPVLDFGFHWCLTLTFTWTWFCNQTLWTVESIFASFCLASEHKSSHPDLLVCKETFCVYKWVIGGWPCWHAVCTRWWRSWTLLLRTTAIWTSPAGSSYLGSVSAPETGPVHQQKGLWWFWNSMEMFCMLLKHTDDFHLLVSELQQQGHFLMHL